MSETRSHRRLRAEADRKRVVRATRTASAAIGNDFFQSLVRHIADALGADCVYLGEVIRGSVSRMVTLSVCLDGEWVDNFEQELSGSASALVLAEGNFVCSVNAAEVFPSDPGVTRVGAQAFVGYRLSSFDGQAQGVLAALFREPLSDLPLARSVMEAFSPRASVELDRKLDHERLRRAEERHRAFIASSTDAMWRIEFEKPVPVSLNEKEQIERLYQYGYVAECNDAFAQLFANRPPEEIVGARFGEIVPPNDARLLEELQSAVRSGYRASVIETTPLDTLGRRTYRLRSQFGIVENGELQRIWGVTRDITELKRAEIALQTAERWCREMLERLQLPAVVVDPAGQVLFANDALLWLAGWSKQELASRNWFDVLADQESRELWTAALLHGSNSTCAHLESSVSSARGKPRLVAWDTTLLLDADGGVEAIAAIGADITSQAAVDAQSRQLQKLEGMGRMAAAIACNLDTPLKVILRHSSLLLRGANGLHASRISAAAIQGAAMQCTSLTEQLPAIGRKQRLDPSVFDLNVLINGAQPAIQNLLGKNITLKLKLDPCLWPARADPAQIERVLTDLATNARDAMAKGGTLVVTTANAEPDELPECEAGCREPGSFVRLAVTDTGVGMTEDVQGCIFDPFYTTKPSGIGAGLGLSTVYGIVAQSGGRIFVHSQPGTGASFEIFLPAAEAAVPASPSLNNLDPHRT